MFHMAAPFFTMFEFLTLSGSGKKVRVNIINITACFFLSRPPAYSFFKKETPAQGGHRSHVFIVNFKQFSNIFLVFPLFTLNK